MDSTSSSLLSSLSLFVILSPIYWKRTKYQYPNSNLHPLHKPILFYPPPLFYLYVPVCALVPIVRFAAPRWLPGQLSLLLLRLPSSFPGSD